MKKIILTLGAIIAFKFVTFAQGGQWNQQSVEKIISWVRAGGDSSFNKKHVSIRRGDYSIFYDIRDTGRLILNGYNFIDTSTFSFSIFAYHTTLSCCQDFNNGKSFEDVFVLRRMWYAYRIQRRIKKFAESI